MRSGQELLGSAFKKLSAAGVELDHRARWDVAGLVPLEKLMVILNDLFIEAEQGGYSYWLVRGYAAKGKYELQRVVAAAVERHYDLDSVAAELTLAMMDAVEKAPASCDCAAGLPGNDAESGVAQAISDGMRFIDASVYEHNRRMWDFVQKLVDAWDQTVDPLQLPPQIPRPRRRIAPFAPAACGILYPRVAVGVTPAGRLLPFHTESLNVYVTYNLAALALWMAGAEHASIIKFVESCAAVRDDVRKVIAICAAWVDIDGEFARTGRPADQAAVVKHLLLRNVPPLDWS